MITRKHITFTGFVQGVGFRWRARHAANLYGCTGWVRNEWDGSVTMEVQGTEEQIDMVLQAINAGRHIEIDHMESKTIPVDETERGFQISRRMHYREMIYELEIWRIQQNIEAFPKSKMIAKALDQEVL